MNAKFVLASNNAKKLKEIESLLVPLGHQLVKQSAFGLPDARENGLSFVENAIIKARHAARLTGHMAIADDSGIEVDALHGKPGIYSARYAGPSATDEDNNAKLIAALENVDTPKRTARYRCVIALLRHAEDPTPIICEGSWEGLILTQPQGEGGFGYDPLFWVESEKCSAAELSAERKSHLSHRGKALQQFGKILSQTFS